MNYICEKCGQNESVTTRKPHCECGGLWKLDYKPPVFSLEGVDKEEWSQFRYRKFMALADETWRDISMGEGMTPIIPLDEEVRLKMDYLMPTLSFKDRGAAVLVAHCKSIGVDKVVQDSSGNAGNSIAAYSASATVAEGIAIEKPMRGGEILRLAKKHGVRFVCAPENKIMEARLALARKGIYCEHTTAANYAAYLEYVRRYGKTPDTLTTMCGAGLKSDH